MPRDASLLLIPYLLINSHTLRGGGFANFRNCRKKLPVGHLPRIIKIPGLRRHTTGRFPNWHEFPNPPIGIHLKIWKTPLSRDFRKYMPG